MTPIVKPERPEAVAPVAYPEIQITETLAFDQILDKVVSNGKRPNKTDSLFRLRGTVGSLISL